MDAGAGHFSQREHQQRDAGHATLATTPLLDVGRVSVSARKKEKTLEGRRNGDTRRPALTTFPHPRYATTQPRRLVNGCIF